MLKFNRICGSVFSSTEIDVTILVLAKAKVSEKNSIAITDMAQMDMKAPKVVAWQSIYVYVVIVVSMLYVNCVWFFNVSAVVVAWGIAGIVDCTLDVHWKD